MGLFDFLHNQKKEEPQTTGNTGKGLNSVDLAFYLFQTLSVGAITPEKYKQAVKKELSSCDKNNTGFPDRQTLLSRVIELAGNPDTPKQRYLLAMAYGWSHAEYRQEAIKYLNLYLSGELFEDAYKNIIFPDDKENPRAEMTPRNYHLWTMYSLLGDAYLGEHEAQNALIAYEKANECAPSFVSTYNAMAKSYVHMNDLQGALNVYRKAKQTEYYFKREWYDDVAEKTREITFWKDIDRGEADILSKIEKGYVYRPRTKKAK